MFPANYPLMQPMIQEGDELVLHAPLPKDMQALIQKMTSHKSALFISGCKQIIDPVTGLLLVPTTVPGKSCDDDEIDCEDENGDYNSNDYATFDDYDEEDEEYYEGDDDDDIISHIQVQQKMNAAGVSKDSSNGNSYGSNRNMKDINPPPVAATTKTVLTLAEQRQLLPSEGFVPMDRLFLNDAEEDNIEWLSTELPETVDYDEL